MEDTQLISLIKSGQKEAISILYKKYLTPIYRFCYYQLNQDRALAEDLTQDIFLNAFKSLNNFKGEGSFKNWLYTIAKRTLNHYLKKKYDLPTTGLFEALDLKPDIITSNQEIYLKKLETLLKTLKPLESQIIIYRYLQNQSIKEVSAKLNLSLSQVKVIAHRSIAKLIKLANQSE